ncbi:hypothetical protein BDV09DRAFT_38842 [Aspergillus tetrazonus]
MTSNQYNTLRVRNGLQANTCVREGLNVILNLIIGFYIVHCTVYTVTTVKIDPASAPGVQFVPLPSIPLILPNVICEHIRIRAQKPESDIVALRLNDGTQISQ